ncbi:MarR family winged helix-turn-helix transcriptional regulator [Actinomadura gamaensis]|uniref:MarR family winged helix-turn-helix transcriptional regulator n=1 Tax=Actinomadura gamaensis TaxID=1763541 RepID=A0ABV9UBP5_9ACTN
MSRSADPSAVYQRYMSALMLHGQASAKAVDLGATDLYALNILKLHGSLTPGELGRRAGLTTGPTTRLVDRLEQAGYVRRVPDADDRRKVIVELVAQPSGLDEALAPVRRKIGAIIQGYTPEQQALLFDYFARAADAFQEATEELRPEA